MPGRTSVKGAVGPIDLLRSYVHDSASDIAANVGWHEGAEVGPLRIDVNDLSPAVNPALATSCPRRQGSRHLALHRFRGPTVDKGPTMVSPATGWRVATDRVPGAVALRGGEPPDVGVRRRSQHARSSWHDPLLAKLASSSSVSPPRVPWCRASCRRMEVLPTDRRYGDVEHRFVSDDDEQRRA